MKRLTVILVTIVSIFSFTITANAAPKMMPDGNYFDAEFYAQNNQDVTSVIGTDEALLYQHYLNFGAAEGRLPYTEDASIPAISSEVIKARLDTVKALYPQGSVWNDDTEYNGYYACHAFAVMLEEKVFGCVLDGTPSFGNRLKYKSQVYPGCVYITWCGDGHIAVITEVTSDGFVVAEGNNNGKVNYKRKITWNSMLNGIKRSKSYELEEVDCSLDDIADYNAAIATYESDSTLIPTGPVTYRVWSSSPGYIAEPYYKK